MHDRLSQLIKGIATGPKASTFIAEADQARDASDWESAAASYRRALDANPELAPIWVQYGHALKESGHKDLAEGAYRKALEIDPNSADTYVQLGHILKIQGRPADALQSYRRALKITPGDVVIKREIDACEKNLGRKFTQTATRNHIYFDISDLIFYIGHHDNLTGIQRVQASIILALLDVNLDDVSIHFLTYVNSQTAFFEIDQSFFIALLYDLALDPTKRKVVFDKIAARDGFVAEATPLTSNPNENNVLCLLGAAWVNKDYFLRLRNLKHNSAFRIAFLIHDLIPIYAKDTCDQGTAEVFTSFLQQCHQIVDRYFCVSESTKSDLVRYFSDQGWSIDAPVVTQNGPLPVLSSDEVLLKTIDADLSAGNYILFVSTIEGRKNHRAAYQAFQKLIQERHDVPYLICVGRLGWKAEDFLFSCEASEFLDGKIKILSDISDSALAVLYRNCLLTIYPSMYEGWGLPVGESLSFGKLCITSNVTSLPEVGGDFAHYVDPTKSGQLAEAIAHYLDVPDALATAEMRIRSDYKPIAWKDIASKIVATCMEISTAPAKLPQPLIELGREYPVCTIPKLPPHLMGEKMVEAISSSRGRVWSPGLYTDSDYLIGDAARIGDGWCQPEQDFTWACIKGASLLFSVPDSSPDQLTVYIAFQAMEPCVGAELIINSTRGVLLNTKIKQMKGNSILVRGVKPVYMLGRKDCILSINIKGSDDLQARLKVIDGRAPAIGIERFSIVAETDFATRLRILEQLYFN